MSSARFTWLAVLALFACRSEPVDPGDSFPYGDPEVAVDDPSDGAFVSGAQAQVSGSAAGGYGSAAEVRVGEQVFPAALGAWTGVVDILPVFAGSPIFPVLAHVEGEGGVWARDRVTQLIGGAGAGSETLADALLLRLTDHLLASALPAVQAEVAAIDLEAQLVTGQPVASSSGFDLFVDRFDSDPLTLSQLEFTAQGIAWGVQLDNLSADVRAESFLLDLDATVEADRIEITGFIVLGTDQGRIVATPNGTNVQITGLQVSGIGGNGLVDSLINNFLSQQLGAQAEAAILDALAGALEAQDEFRTLAFEGLVIQNDFTSVAHDEDGVTVRAASTVRTDTGPLVGSRLANPQPAPTPSGQAQFGVTYGLGLWLDDDLISALGVGLHERGLLEQEISGDAGGFSLSTDLLAGLITGLDGLPSGKPVTIRTHGTVAPAGTAGEAEGEAARLHIGGMQLDFLADVEGTGTESVVLSGAIDVVLAIAADEEALFKLDLAENRMDATYAAVAGVDPAEVETKLGGLLAAVLPGVLGGLLDGLGDNLGGIEVLGSGNQGDRGVLLLDADLAALLDDQAPAR